MKLQKRLFLSYILLSVLPLLLILFVFLGQYTKDMMEKQESNTINLTDNILERIDGMVDEVDRMLNIVYNLSEFEEHITEAGQIASDSPDFAYDFLRADLKLKEDLSYLVYDKSVIEDIILIDNAGRNHYIGSNLFEYQKDFRTFDFYLDIVEANGRCYVFSKGCGELYKNKSPEYFAIAKVIKSRENMENIGVILVTIRLEVLLQMIENYMETDEYCTIMTQKDVLMESALDIGSLQSAWAGDTVRAKETIDGTDYWIYGKESTDTGLQILWISPCWRMVENASSIFVSVFLIAVLLIVSCFAVSFGIAKAISKPIVELDTMARNMAAGELDGRIPEMSAAAEKYEVGQLTHSFIAMKQQINSLLLKERRSRTEYLANQINPHFLYNTLDSAYMSAIANDDMDTAEIIGQINLLLKMIVREQNMVTLKKELEIVDAYVSIQKMRYPGKFEYRVMMDGDLGNKIVPKMILQPIVENAITHGVLELDEMGFIYIIISCNDDILHLRVINGPGRKDDVQLESMNRSIKDHDVYRVLHIGLKNIYERLTLNYSDSVEMAARNSDEYDAIEVDLKFNLSSRN